MNAGKAIGAFEDTTEVPTVPARATAATNITEIPIPVTVALTAPVLLAISINATAYENKLRERLDAAQIGTSKNVIGQLQSALSALAKAGCTDEDQRLHMAVNVLDGTLGITTQQIIDAYTNLQGLLATESEAFNKALSARSGDISTHQNTITSINTQIRDLTAQRDAAAAELTSIKTSIEQGRSGFDAAVVKIRAEIDTSLNKLRSSQSITPKGQMTNA